MRGTILTLGGGGFSMPEVHGRDFSPLDSELTRMSGKERPRVCFVATASGDADSYHDKFLAAYADRAEAKVLSLFNKAPEGYELPINGLEQLLDQDIVYVGGGSTANLLAVWRLHGLPALLEKAAAGGTILAGISAGANCWYEASSTDSFGPTAPLPDGLGFLPGSFCPHYLGEEDRRETYVRFVGSGALPAGYAADDGVALLWRDGELVEAISERPDGVAYAVGQDGEATLDVRVLD
ncbi:peptidase E [Nocardioides albus]|uniref:Peptidase E n=1 Tax=Nocardioides albus TaxID=1841 RepID=A0A7W5A737_9ACTN|nr:peptidase E [Nocardioides albus]MBB3090604.1 peptidase E [Nocardioides albus]GGU25093.1 putative peptidase YgaJ [Nocardioides albus]